MKIWIIIGILLTLIGVVLCRSLLAADSDVQSKLKALEAAHKAGILTDEEYARKKAELMGQPAGGSLALYRDPRGLFQFQHPRDWTVQALPKGQGVTLKRGQAAVSIMLFPAGAAAQELLESIAEQIRGQWQDYRELKRGERKVGGRAAPLVEFIGVNPQGMRAHSQMMVLAASGTGYVFLLSAPENEFAVVQTAWRPLLDSFKAGDTLPTGKKGKTYRHPIGFTFWYPENWKVQETQVGLQIIPPDVKSNQYGPSEAYIVIGQPAGGISRPDDPLIIQYLEGQLMTILPFLRRTGKVESVTASSRTGALITWEGQNPTGMQIRARVFVVLLKGYGVALVGLGEKDRIDARKSTLREIFSTFGFGEGEKDRRLVGIWRYESYFSSDAFLSTSIRYMVLRPDGTFSSGGRFLASAQHQDQYGDLSGSSTLDTGKDPGERGRWGAGNGKLYLIWDDGSYAEYGYHVEGAPGNRKMLLKPANGKNELWEEVR